MYARYKKKKEREQTGLCAVPLSQWLDTYVASEVIPLDKSRQTSFLTHGCP